MRIAPLMLAALLFAGCTTPTTPQDQPPIVTPDPQPLAHVIVAATNAMTFNQSIVTPAVGLSNDLYEPLLEVSDTGAIYVAAHVAVAVTTGTPAYVSNDDGATWKPLPFLNAVAVPSPGQGSALPSGDEGMIVAGAGGHAYMADVALHSFPVEGWCDNGATQCYHNPNAYDRVAATTQCGTNGAQSLNDRPWAAYANGTLLLSNNAGTGAVQIGVMQVPPALPGDVRPATWNMCANQGTSGFLPGIPAMRDDLQFAVPQIQGQSMAVVTGNAKDVSKTQVVQAFDVTVDSFPAFGGGPNFGASAFDKAGDLYVVAMNNTKKTGQFAVGISTDAGANFTLTTFQTSARIGFLNVDGNMRGPGALVTWIQDGSGAGKADAYAAHLSVVKGRAGISDVSLVAKDIVTPCGDVMGSGAGPDGRAYMVVFADPNTCLDTPGSHPLSVYVQGKGTAVLPGFT